MLNKQIDGELGTTERIVKFHRGHIMRKMQVQSLAELVRMARRWESQPKSREKSGVRRLRVGRGSVRTGVGASSPAQAELHPTVHIPCPQVQWNSPTYSRIPVLQHATLRPENPFGIRPR